MIARSPAAHPTPAARPENPGSPMPQGMVLDGSGRKLDARSMKLPSVVDAII